MHVSCFYHLCASPTIVRHSVWNPYFKCDVDLIESTQRAFTRKLFYPCGLAPASYDNRLHVLQQRLELRLIYNDLYLLFKPTQNTVNCCLRDTISYVHVLVCEVTVTSCLSLLLTNWCLAHTSFIALYVSGIRYLFHVLLPIHLVLLKTRYVA